MIALLGAGTISCGEKSSDSSTDSGSSTKKKPSVRGQYEVWRSLLAESGRAELRQQGLLIDLGSSDQSKYVRGGWETGWQNLRGRNGQTTFATVGAGDARLFFLQSDKSEKIVMRVRGKGSLQILKGKKSIGEIALKNKWSLVTVNSSLESGRHELRLRGQGADVDWVHISTAAKPRAWKKSGSVFERVVPLKLAGALRRALVTQKDAKYSFYLQPPKDGMLIFDIGSDGVGSDGKSAKTEFLVTAESAEGDVQEIFKASLERGAWEEHHVDLSPFAGKALRLSFETRNSGATAGWGEPVIALKNLERRTAPSSSPKNIVFVVLDTTRFEAFFPYSEYKRIKTPNLDAFRKRSAIFLNAYNNENWTKPSIASLWSGVYPETHTARLATSKLPKEVFLLPEHLKKNGLKTAAFIANAVVDKQFGFDRGWDEFNNWSRNSGGNGDELYAGAAKWLETNHKKPFFLYIQSVEPHTTYEVPAKYSSLYFKGGYSGPIGPSFGREEQVVVDNFKMKISDTDLDWIRALYWGEVTYQDVYLGKLLKKLEELGRLKDTMVVITNDHGEELREHGHMGHGWTLYDEMIRAPLSIYYPPIFGGSAKNGNQIEEIVEHVDVAPTIVDALGFSPLPDAEGQSLLPLVIDRPASPKPMYAVAWSRNKQRAVRVGPWKLVTHSDKGWLSLFDLKNDPNEKKNRLKDRQIAGRLCEIYLGEALASLNKSDRLRGLKKTKVIPKEAAEMDAETRKKMEALGYL